jgi:hypothetical protein
VYYRRRPTGIQIALGVAFIVLASSLLGYLPDADTSRVWLNVAAAIILGWVIYVATLAYLVYVYVPKREKLAAPA